MAQTYNISDVMLSYSRKDKPFVQRLEQALSQSGREVWIDWQDIAPTVDWWAEIKAGIEAAHTFVFIMTPNSIRSEICRQEIDHAVNNGKRLVPVLYEEITDPADVARVHPALNKHNWIYMRETDNFQEGFKTLVKALETDMTHAQAHTRLLVRAREWEENGGGSSRLLRGDDLVAAEAWLTAGLNKSPEPTALQAKYIAQSRKIANRNRQGLMAAALVTMFLLSLLSLFGLDRSTVAASEAANAQTQAANAQEQAAIAKTQEAAAIKNLETAQAAEKKSQLLDEARETQQKIAEESRADAFLQQTNAFVIQETANFAATDAVNLQLTSDMAGTDAANLQITAGTNAGHLQTTAQYAGTQAAKQAQDAGIAATQAANAQKQAQAAQAQAANAQATAASAQQTANANAANADSAGTQAAIAKTQIAESALKAATDSAKATVVAKTATNAAITATYSYGTATQAALNATQAYVSGQTATVVAIESHTMNLINAASGLQTIDPGLAVHLALLAVKRNDAPATASSYVESLLNTVVYTAVKNERTFLGHGYYVKSVAYSPDGVTIASGSSDHIHSLLVWDVLTGQKSKELHAGIAASSVVYLNNLFLVSGAADGIRLWNLSTGNITMSIRANVVCLSVSPDGKKVAAGLADKTVLVWDFDGSSLIKPTRLVTQGVVRSITFGPDNDTVIFVSSKTLSVRKLSNNTFVRDFVDTSNLLSVAFNMETSLIATGGDDNKIKLWQDMNTGLVLKKTFPEHDGAVNSVKFSRDGSFIVSGSSDTTVRLWDVVAGKQLGLSFKGHRGAVTEVALSPDNRMVASSSDDGTIRSWQIVPPYQSGLPFMGYGGEITSFDINPHDENQIITGSSKGEFQLWDIQARSYIPLSGSFLKDQVIVIDFNPADPTQFLSLSYTVTNGISLHIWKINGSTISSVSNIRGQFYGASFNAAGDTIVYGGYDKTVLTASIDKNGIVSNLKSHYKHDDSVDATVFSPDGTKILSASNDRTLKLWNIADGTTKIFSGHRGQVRKILFNPVDNTQILSSAEDGTLFLWDSNTGKPIGVPFIGYGPMVFSPDAKRIALSGITTLRVWDTATRQQIGPDFVGHSGVVAGLAFINTGKVIVSAATDGTVRLWMNRNLQEMIDLACNSVSIRPLTPEEKAYYRIKSDHPCAIDDVLPAVSTTLDTSLDLAQSLQDSPLPIEPIPSIATEDVIAPAWLTLPIYASMDDGARDWTAEGGWVLSEAGRFGETGSGWFIDARGDGALTSTIPIDLSGASQPHLLLQSRLSDKAADAVGMIWISVNGGDWMLLKTIDMTNDWMQFDIDLSSYRDQVIALQFVWVKGTDADATWSLDELRIEDRLLTTETPTLTPTVPETATLDVIATETPASELTITFETPTPISTLDWTPSPTATLWQATATPTATLMPLSLPVVANMEDATFSWTSSGGWTLSEAGRYGDAGLGWLVSGITEPLTVLSWGQPLDLRYAHSPRLRFASRLQSEEPLALVQISTDGVNWHFLSLAADTDGWREESIDLSGYRGQIVALQWVWLHPTTEGNFSWAIDDVIVEDVLVSPTPIVLPTELPIVLTAAPTETWVIPTEPPTLTPTAIETETPTLLPPPTEPVAEVATQEPS